MVFKNFFSGIRGKTIIGYFIFMIATSILCAAVIVPNFTNRISQSFFDLISNDSFVMAKKFYNDVESENPKTNDDLYKYIYGYDSSHRGSVSFPTTGVQIVAVYSKYNNSYHFWDPKKEVWNSDLEKYKYSTPLLECTNSPEEKTDLKYTKNSSDTIVYRTCETKIYLEDKNELSESSVLPVSIISVSLPFKLANETETIRLSYIYDSLDLQGDVNNIKAFSWVIYTAFGILLLLFLIIILQMVYRPLIKINKDIELIKKGNLNLRIMRTGLGYEIDNLISTINKALDDVNSTIYRLQKNNAKEMEFISHIAHELRNPIASISMSIELLTQINQNMTNEERRLIDIVKERNTYLRNIINDLLEESHLKKGGGDLSVSIVNLNELIREEIRNVADSAKEYNTKIIFKPAEENDLIVETDKERVRSVIRNLLYNAIEFSNKKPITVMLLLIDKSIGIKVSDKGLGVPDDAKDKIFKRHFSSSENNNRKYGGSGLGLYISKQNAKMLNGQLALSEQAGPGAAFLFSIPNTKKKL
ncbi:MAG: HAMP domain-containing histidine kinase [Bifidobacteriaceae bacterium]|nr:HAMP domain-containing histidine kinase [Bifidobacteriaceae bacterium]